MAIPRPSVTARLALVFKAPKGPCFQAARGCENQPIATQTQEGYEKSGQWPAQEREERLLGQGVTIRREGFRYFHCTGLGALLCSLTYDMSLCARSFTEVKTPRVMTAR